MKLRSPPNQTNKNSGPTLDRMDEKELPTMQEDLHTELAAAGIADATKRASIIEEFDLLSISDNVEELAWPVAKKVKERIEAYANLLEGLLQPDTTLNAMNECSFFNEEKQRRIGKLYRKLMHLVRSHTEADIEATRDAHLQFVREALATWEQERPNILAIARDLKKGWEREEPLQRERGYFG